MSNLLTHNKLKFILMFNVFRLSMYNSYLYNTFGHSDIKHHITSLNKITLTAL